MIKVLVKKQLMEIFRSYFYNPKNNTRRSTLSTVMFIIMYAILMVGVLGGMFTFLSITLCSSLHMLELDWLYFALMSMIGIVLGAFGSVFNTYSGLYLAKDNDLLLSMPIPVRSIMTSRLLGVYLLGLCYSAVVTVPAVVVYLIVTPFKISALVGGILLIVLVSVFVLILSCLLGWVVAKISLKLKNKSFITVIVSLAFIAAYYFVYFKAQSALREFLENAGEYGARIKGAAYPFYILGKAGAGDWLSMAVCTIVIAALFALTWRILSRSFIGIATSSGSAPKVKRKVRASKLKSVRSALLGKELRRFASNSSYMLNCGLSTLLLPIAGILLIIKGRALTDVLGGVFGAETAAVLLCAAICLVASMNMIAVPSVSLEGRSIWIAQSLPVTPWQNLRAKLDTHILLTGVPALFCALCAALVMKCSPALRVMIVITVVIESLLFACFDLFIGVIRANVNWTNEVVPIKQSVAVLLAMLVGMVWGVAVGALFLLVGRDLGAVTYLLIVCVISAALSAMMFFWLRAGGSKRFETL